MLTRLHIIWSFAQWNIHFRLKFHTFVIMHFMTMSLSVKHLHQTFVINFTKQMIKKKLNSTQACLWRLLHEEISDIDQFIINEIACSPFETRKLRRLICHWNTHVFPIFGHVKFWPVKVLFLFKADRIW